MFASLFFAECDTAVGPCVYRLSKINWSAHVRTACQPTVPSESSATATAPVLRPASVLQRLPQGNIATGSAISVGLKIASASPARNQRFLHRQWKKSAQMKKTTADT